MALSGSGSVSNYTTRTFGPFTRAGVSPWSRTTGLQLTLSCWVRCRAAPSGLQTFFGIGNFAEVTFFQLLVDTNFVFRAWYANNSGGAQAIALSASNAAAVGDWVHLMGTLDCTSNPRATLYIGGTSYTAASGSDTSGSTFNNVTLHRRPSSTATTAAPTTTDVAEVAVYAGLLSAGDAEALRLGQNPLAVEGHRLLAYFPLRHDVQDLSPYAIGLTHSAAYALAWSDHPPVQQLPLNRILRASFPDLTATITGEIPITAEITANLSPFVVDGGDTHDGFKRRSRRERALAAAERRRRDEMAQEAVALRLSLEAAMGMAAEVPDDTPAEAVEAVEAVARQAARLVPTLADSRADEALLAAAREAVAALRAAVEEAERARALAEDDEEVFMLLRAL